MVKFSPVARRKYWPVNVNWCETCVFIVAPRLRSCRDMSAIAPPGEEIDMSAFHGHPIPPSVTPGPLVLPGRILGPHDGASRGIALRPLPRRSPLAMLRADPRQAVEHDLIRCLVCGSGFRQLTNTHLPNPRMTAHAYKRQLRYNPAPPLIRHP